MSEWLPQEEEHRGRRARMAWGAGALVLVLAAGFAVAVLAMGGEWGRDAADAGPGEASATVPAPSTSPAHPEQTEQPTPTPEVTTAPPTETEEPEETTAPPSETDGTPEPNTGTDDPAATDDSEQPGTPTDSAGGDSEWGEPLAECSTSAYTAGSAQTEGLPEEVARTAVALVRDAMRCDEQALVERAARDDTWLSVGEVTAQEALSIPQEDPQYLVMAALLTQTDWTLLQLGTQEPFYAWPAVADTETASEEDWQDLREAGVMDPGLLEDMQRHGYYNGWRVGITKSGEWRVLVAGD
ncbi:hypothetical protein [Ornithinicoccus halotolerans]|uniref:hypothetical protein n=1 Tax=Ornithinicoccus halotolerans TaxID=1748220 RepID=UPI0012980DE4|nr:hypothetical protein [Ornithinicoccus halotolerans]